MLELLRIRNLALIEDAELEFAAGMNVLTGETGAGKSFILRAIDFLLGEKLSPDMVRPGADKATAEALFAADGTETVIRRELAADTGRSRLYVNDALSSQDAVRALAPSLVLHTSQHAGTRLLSPAYQSALLDAFVAPALTAARDAGLAALRDVLARRRELTGRIAALQERRELLEYQRAEISKVNPKPGEEDELVARKQEIKAREKAGQAAAAALALLSGPGGVLDPLGRLVRELAQLADLGPDYADGSEAAAGLRERLLDLEANLRNRDLDSEAGSLDAIEARLWELAKLKRSLKRDLAEIVHLRAEVEENLSFLDACGLDLKRLDKEEAAAAKALGQALSALNAARREAAAVFASRMETELRDLGFSAHARVEVDFSPLELHPGLSEDRARILWIPNPGQPAQPLDRIASGGELSRFVLAVAGLKGEDGRPTLIFDEVDSGIGGLTLNHVAAKLKALSGRQQLVVITHWPQIACAAGRHFLVQKEVREARTYTTCRPLPPAEIKTELARMAGGGEKGEALAGKLIQSPSN